MNKVLKEITYVDKTIKRNFTNAHTSIPSQADIFFKWFPVIYVLSAHTTGVKMQSPLIKRVLIILLSEAILNSYIYPLKKFVKRRRPDSIFKYNSFPSRHTAVSFCGAEILYTEIKAHSKTLALSGYAAAITTASLRVYRRKHWLSDVIVGSIIGIVSCKLSYFTYQKLFGHVDKT